MIQKILQEQFQTIGRESKKIEEQILAIIREIENKHGSEFLGILQNVSQFQILIARYTSLSHLELIEGNLEIEKSLQLQLDQAIISINNIYNYFDKFRFQISNIKRNFLKLLEQQEFKGVLKESVSQINPVQIVIQLFNPQLILKLIKESLEYYEKQLQENIQIENVKDVQQILRIIHSNINIYKGFEIILKQHQKILLSTSTLIQGVFEKLSFGHIQNKQQCEIDIKQYIKAFILKIREQLDLLFQKYQNQEFTKEEQTDLSIIQNQLSNEMNKIKLMDWTDQIKIQHTSLLSEIENQLEYIGLVQDDKNNIKQEILILLDDHLKDINSEDKPKEGLPLTKVIKQSSTNNEFLKLKLQDFFDCEGPLNNLEKLIIKSKKIKKIIKQNLCNPASKILQTNLELLNNLKETKKLNLKKAIIDLQNQTIAFCKMISKHEQIIFKAEFLKKSENQTYIKQIPKLLRIFNFDTLSFQYQGGVNKVGKVDIINNMIAELATDMKINEEENTFDIFSNSSYKVRELVVFNLIKIQSIIQEQPIQEFCENLLKQIWIIEKHPSVRSLLKNEEMVSMQKKLFSHDLQNFSLKIKTDMRSRLKQIEQLENQVLLSENQDEIKNSLQQEYDDFEIYLDNITDMAQRLDISLIFLKEISKDLKNIRSSINSILKSVKSVVDDIRRLRGKNFMELLTIRKQKVLYQKLENEQDQIHIEIKTQEYDPISGNKKQNKNGESVTFLMKLEYNNYDGEVNEFLWSEDEKQKDVMLIKGKAGSGKSRASRNIEEFIWISDSISPNWIPIYVSLPSIKDPNHNLIEQALESENYNFDNIQIREFKDAVINGKLRIVIILESYDEMNVDFIGTNLYNTNRVAYDLNLQAQEQKVKFIITTREEILNLLGYQTWFYGSSLQNLKEVEILPFDQEQSFQYLKIYTEISVKRTIKRFYEFLKQLKGQNFQLQEFKLIWSQIENPINSILLQRRKFDMLFLISDIEQILKTIQNVDFFSFIKSNQMLSLKKELLQLWGEQKFQSVIKNINIAHLLSTPFMMEIIVYVLPKMFSLFSKTNKFRELLKKNFMILKREAKNSESNSEIYSNYRNNNFNLEVENENEIKIKMMTELEINQQFTEILEDLNNQNFFESFSIADSLEYINNATIVSNKNFNVRFDANFIVSAFKLHEYTAFEFYEIFVNFYHNQQVQKLKDLGKSIKEEIMLQDLQDFSIFLAIDMSMRQLTQVNYKQKGKLYISQVQEERKVEVSWEDSYFSENQDDFEYKTLLRKCVLINSKGSLYAFNHKSIQEFFVAKYILNVVEKIFLQENQKLNENFLNKSSFNKNQFNLSQEHYFGTLELLKPKIKQIDDIKSQLIQIALSYKKDTEYNLIRSASNSIYILGSLREHLDNIDLRNLNIADTKLNGISFSQCNLSNSQLNNVSIDSCNFNYATIENATWKNLICKEKPSIKAHSETIQQVVFSDDGNFLISGSRDGVIIKQELSADSEIKKAMLPNDDYLQKFSIGKNLLACLSQQFLYLYNLIDLRELKKFPKTSEYFQGVDIHISSNDKYLAVSLRNGKILFLLVENLLQQSAQQPKYLSRQKNQNIIECIAISPNYQLLATGDTQIKIWNSTKISDVQLILELPQQNHSILAIAFSKDNQVLAVARENEKLEFWNIENLNKVLLQYTFYSQQSIQQIVYSNNGSLFASRSQNFLKVHDVQKLPDQQDYFKINSNLQVDLMEISQDGAILAISHTQTSESHNPKITIWDIKNLQQIKRKSVFEKHQKNIKTLKFRNDNLVLGSGGLDNTICLWDLLRLQLIVKLTSHSDQVLDLAFSQDGDQMVSSSLDGTIIFWSITNLDKPQIQYTLQQQLGTKKLIFCPNSSLLVSLYGYSQDEIIQWNSTEFKKISTQKQQTQFIDINFSENGDIMVSLNQDRFLRIWKRNELCFDVEKQIKIEGEEQLYKAYCLNSQNIIAHIGQFVYQLQINDEEIQKKHRFRFSEKADGISVSQNNKIITMKDSQDLNRIQIIIIENHNSQNNIYFEEQDKINDFQFSFDTSLLAVATTKGAFIKDIQTNQILQNFQQNTYCFLICFIWKEILAIVLEGSLVLYDIYDIDSTKTIFIIQLCDIPLKLVFLEQRKEIAIYSKNSLILISLLELSQIKLIQFDEKEQSRNLIFNSEQLFMGRGAGQQIQFISLSNAITIEKIVKLQDTKGQHDQKYTNFSQDCNVFSVLYKDLKYFQFEISSNRIQKQVNLKMFDPSPCALNNQETLLIVSQSKYENETLVIKLILIDVVTQKTVTCFEEIRENKFKCQNIVFSQDGQNFVSSYLDQSIKFWDTKSCKLLATFKADTNYIQILTISRKGILAQASNNIIKLWDLNALKQQQLEMDGHSSSVQELCISSDGLQLVTGSQEEIIRWDLIELKKLDTLIKGKRLPSTFCFSPNSHYFIALTKQSIHIWKFNTKYIIEFHKIYWCEFEWEHSLNVDQNLVIFRNCKSKIFIWDLEQVDKQNQIKFQSDLKIQTKTIILSKNLLIKTNPLEIIHINNKLELQNELIIGVSAGQARKIAYCANSLRFAFEDQDHSIIIWSIEKKQIVGKLNSNELLLSMAFSGNSRIFCSCHIDEKIRLWNITDKFELIEFQVSRFSRPLENSLHIHPVKDEEFIFIWSEGVSDEHGCSSAIIVFQIDNAKKELDKVYYQDTCQLKFQTAFNQSNKLIALQFQTILKLYNISQEQVRVIANLESNPLDNLLCSSNLIFSSDGRTLLSLGTDFTVRLFDFSDQSSIKVKINMKKPIQALAMQFLNSETIRIFNESGVIIDQNISEYTEICVIKDKYEPDFKAVKQKLEVPKYRGQIKNGALEIFDSLTNQLQYTLKKFSSKVNAISFTPSQKQFILGMDDGSIFFYKIDQQTIKNYTIPVCYHIFAKSPLLTAVNCNIRQSTFSTNQNENFEKVLCEKGAIK